MPCWKQLDSLVDDVLDRLPDLEQLLASPRIPLSQKNRVLDETFAGQMDPVLLNFLKVTARRGRLDCLRQIRDAAGKLDNEMRGRVEVTVETAQRDQPAGRGSDRAAVDRGTWPPGGTLLQRQPGRCWAAWSCASATPCTTAAWTSGWRECIATHWTKQRD